VQSVCAPVRQAARRGPETEEPPLISPPTFAASQNAPLADYVVYDSGDVDAAAGVISTLFTAHDADPRGEAVTTTQVRHAPLADTSFNYIRYGRPMGVRPGEFESFYLLQVQHRGETVLQRNADTLRLAPGAGCVTGPGERIGMEWDARSAQFVVRLDRRSVERRLEALLEQPLCEPLRFARAIAFRAPKQRMIWRLIHSAIDDLDAGAGAGLLAEAAAARPFEDMLINALLLSQPHNYAQGLRGGLSPAAPRHVTVAERYIGDHIAEPITVADLVAATGVSARALHDGFAKFRGLSPMRYVRRRRLDGVRRDLMAAAPGETVTAIASRWGVSQLGRFAVEYKAFFGESPSETLRRARLG